ncbi:MAG: ATP-binding protein [bacterium]
MFSGRHYPGPDRSVRLNELRAGRALPRRYRNRRIGEFLKELDMTEGRATGIPKILHAMKANGSPPPVFDFDADHTFFMCRLPVHPQAKLLESLPGHEVKQGSGKGGSGVQSGVQSQMAISVLQALRQDAAGKASIAKLLGKTGRTR